MNQDIGFVHAGKQVKLKLLSYPFQKYGMVDGKVENIGADASETAQQGSGQAGFAASKSVYAQPFSYRALIELKTQALIVNGESYPLTPGMQVTAEIHLGTRTVLEYLLSPVMGAFQEAGRER